MVTEQNGLYFLQHIHEVKNEHQSDEGLNDRVSTKFRIESGGLSLTDRSLNGLMLKFPSQAFFAGEVGAASPRVKKAFISSGIPPAPLCLVPVHAHSDTMHSVPLSFRRNGGWLIKVKVREPDKNLCKEVCSRIGPKLMCLIA